MTLTDLHNIKDFAELFRDPRFIAMQHYLRENIDKPRVEVGGAEMLIYRGAHTEGWLAAISAQSRLAIPPKPETPTRPQQLYAESPSLAQQRH